MQEIFQVGAIVSTHGIKGEVKVFPTTDDPEKFRRLKKVIVKTDKEERELEIFSARFFKNMVIVQFKEWDSINEAEKYKGATLWITRQEAVPLEENEYYQADLIGLQVIEESGEILGALTEIFSTGANDVYEVTLEDGRKALLPAIKDCIKDVNLKDGKMTVRLLDGLLD